MMILVFRISVLTSFFMATIVHTNVSATVYYWLMYQPSQVTLAVLRILSVSNNIYD